jgi:hypothetical protein
MNSRLGTEVNRTISRDNSIGDITRRSILLAELAKKICRSAYGGVRAKAGVIKNADAFSVYATITIIIKFTSSYFDSEPSKTNCFTCLAFSMEYLCCYCAVQAGFETCSDSCEVSSCCHLKNASYECKIVKQGQPEVAGLVNFSSHRWRPENGTCIKFHIKKGHDGINPTSRSR